MDRLIDSVSLWLARRSRLAAFIAVIFLVLIASLIRPPNFVGSMVNETSIDNPQALAAERIAVALGSRRTSLLIVAAGEALIGDAFAAISELESSLGASVELRSVHALQGRLFLFGLTPGDSLSALLVAIRQDDELGMMVSRDGALFGVAIAVPPEEEDDVLQAAREYVLSGGLVTVNLLSASALRNDIAEGLRLDFRLLIPAIISVMLALFLLAFGHWRALVLPVLASVASSTIVFGLLSIADISVNLVTMLALPIVLILVLANCCHFLAAAGSSMPAADSGNALVAVILRRVGLPYLISCLTTAVALASLGFNEIVPIRDLGLLSAVALVVSFFVVLLFAPWGLGWYLCASRTPVRDARLPMALSRAMRRWRSVSAATLVVMAIASLFAFPSIEVRSSARVFFPDSGAFTRALHLFEERFHAFAPLRVLVLDGAAETPSLGALKFAGELRDMLLEVPGIRGARLAAAATGGGFIVTAAVSDDALTDDIAAHLEAFREQGNRDFEFIYSSAQLVYQSIDQQALASLAMSLGLSVILVFGVIVLVFRSLRTLFAALAANAVPLFILVGAVWLSGSPLNIVTAFVFLVALGVIVDDTIHILYWHHAGERLAGSSIEYSVLLSTIMLSSGLMLCLLSDFPTTRQFAAYCALALTTAVCSDLTLLPAMLRGQQGK